MDIEPKSKANQVTRRIGRKQQESGGTTAAGIRARSISPNEVRLREKACSERGRPAPLPGNTPPSPTYATGPCSNLRTGNRTPAQIPHLEARRRVILVTSGKKHRLQSRRTSPARSLKQGSGTGFQSRSKDNLPAQNVERRNLLQSGYNVLAQGGMHCIFLCRPTLPSQSILTDGGTCAGDRLASRLYSWLRSMGTLRELQQIGLRVLQEYIVRNRMGIGSGCNSV